MTSKPVFRTVTRDFWSDLDQVQSSGDLEESTEEAAAYDEGVAKEISSKVLEMRELGTAAPSSDGGLQDNGFLQQDDPVHEVPPEEVERPNIPVERAGKSLLDAIDTFTPRRPPTATLPHVPTPSNITPKLPDPPIRSGIPRRSHVPLILDTPVHVESPKDTPRPTGAVDAQQPDTPAPIGTNALAHFQGKKDLQTLTKTFEAFNKDLAKLEVKLSKGAARAKTKDKGKLLSKTESVVLGSKVLDGLRFCIPPEVGQVSKHKQRWGIIASLGGQVTLQPDTATTHVIYDRASASMLYRELGIRTLSELPANCVCVKWEYVAQCKLQGRLFDPKYWLSFPETSLTRKTTLSKTSAGSSRMIDITDQLQGRSTSITRKRPDTASESDTESSKRPYRAKGFQAASALLSRAKSTTRPPATTTTPDVATKHDLPSGLGWEAAPAGREDGLDAMISGVKNGTADEGAIDEDSPEPNADRPELHRPMSNPDARGDAWKCGQDHNGTSNKGPNEWLAAKFAEMHDMYQGVQGKNSFSVRQYQQVASILRRTTEPITCGEQANKIKGIGQSAADRIDEFISGGVGRQFYETNEKTQIVARFKDIHGVGTNFANELYRLGARTIEDLRTHNYGLTMGQMIGVELYDDLQSRIPRPECRKIFELIKLEALKIDSKVWIEIMGSYRRGQEDSGDVDILITRDPSDGLTHAGVLQSLVSVLKQNGFITHDLSLPHEWKALEAKWMGVCRIGPKEKYRRLDILCIPFANWGATLIYFTGNEIFNRSLRLYARKKGYSLNQRGLSHGVIRGKDGLKQTEGEIIASRTEQDIFDVLGLRWRHPHQRRP